MSDLAETRHGDHEPPSPLDRRRRAAAEIAMLRRGPPLAIPLVTALPSLMVAAWLAGTPWTAQAICAVLLGRLTAFASFRLDRLEWGEWGFEEALRWTLAAAVGGGIGASVSAAGGSLSAPAVAAESLLYWSAGLVLEGAFRLRLRRAPAPATLERPRRLLIYGSGLEARELAAQLRRRSGYWEPCGYLDDDLRRLQAVLDGLPIMGDLESLPLLARLHHVSDLFVVGPACGERVYEIAERARVCVRIKPAAQLGDE